ncbi:Fibronectin type III domain-containing protein 1 [Bienertia sinuspersici]
MSFEQQVKERTHELKNLFSKGIKVVSKYSKKGWVKVKNLRK